MDGMDQRFTGELRRADTDATSTSVVIEAFLPPIYVPDSHAANLVELDNGDLLCVWFNGPKEGDPKTNVVMSRLPAGGDAWTRPRLLAADPHRSEQNPVLAVDDSGVVWLWHTSAEPHNQKTSRVIVRKSDDGGHSWSPPEVLFAEPGIFVRNPPIRLRSGAWLLPAYYCRPGADVSVVKFSDDDGKSWTERPVPDSEHRVQMTLAERADGSILGLFRSRDADRIWASESRNGGHTWSSPTPTDLPNNNSSIQLIKLHDGTMALVYNDASLERDQFRWVGTEGNLRKKAVRTPLTLALSPNDGATWPVRRNVQQADLEYRDNELGYSYPAILQTRDGLLHIAFSYLRKTIKYVRVDQAWVKGSRGS